jgi:hypothetical protein
VGVAAVGGARVPRRGALLACMHVCAWRGVASVRTQLGPCASLQLQQEHHKHAQCLPLDCDCQHALKQVGLQLLLRVAIQPGGVDRGGGVGPVCSRCRWCRWCCHDVLCGMVCVCVCVCVGVGGWRICLRGGGGGGSAPPSRV